MNERSNAHDSDDCAFDCEHPVHALEGSVIDLRHLLGENAFDQPDESDMEPVFL